MLLLLLSRFSRVWLCVTPETAAHQAPPSLGFSRQEHWSGLPFLLQCMKGKSESEVVQLCPTPATPWIAAYQAPPSLGFSRQEDWSGVPLPSPRKVLVAVKDLRYFLYTCIHIYCMYILCVLADKGPFRQSYGFSNSHARMWELDCKERWALKNRCFWTVVLEKTLESPLDCKEIQPVHPKGNQSWIIIGRNDAEAETPILWPSDAQNWLIGRDPDAGKDWRQEEKGMAEDEMVGWHHWLNGQ